MSMNKSSLYFFKQRIWLQLQSLWHSCDHGCILHFVTWAYNIFDKKQNLIVEKTKVFCPKTIKNGPKATGNNTKAILPGQI